MTLELELGAYNAKKNEYQKEKRLNESKEQREAGLQVDSDSLWHCLKELGKIVSGYAIRFQAAKKHRQEKPWLCDMSKPLSVPYLTSIKLKKKLLKIT